MGVNASRTLDTAASHKLFMPRSTRMDVNAKNPQEADATTDQGIKQQQQMFSTFPLL